MLKKYEVVRFMVDMIHAISALRAVEVACAHHVMISARSAGTSPTVSYRFHREFIESNCQLQRTILKKTKVGLNFSQRLRPLHGMQNQSRSVHCRTVPHENRALELILHLYWGGLCPIERIACMHPTY